MCAWELRLDSPGLLTIMIIDSECVMCSGHGGLSNPLFSDFKAPLKTVFRTPKLDARISLKNYCIIM